MSLVYLILNLWFLCYLPGPPSLPTIEYLVQSFLLHPQVQHDFQKLQLPLDLSNIMASQLIHVDISRDLHLISTHPEKFVGHALDMTINWKVPFLQLSLQSPYFLIIVLCFFPLIYIFSVLCTGSAMVWPFYFLLWSLVFNYTYWLIIIPFLLVF